MDANAAAVRLAQQQDAFLKFVRRQVSDPDLALDILQESFLKALAKAGDLRDENALVPWFYRILRSVAGDAHRRKARQTQAERQLAVEPSNGEASGDAAAARSVVNKCLESLLPQMTPAYAELIRELDLAEADAGAYAQSHGVTPGALKVKRHRARRQLQKLIETACRCPIDPTADCVCGCY